MLRRFVILSGSSITPRSETARSAKEAMELVLQLMKLRRPGVRIETAEGEPLSFFQLKELVASEGRKRECLKARKARSALADVIGNAVKVMRIATSEDQEDYDDVAPEERARQGARRIQPPRRELRRSGGGDG